ncbi:MAG: hypothetical protein HQM12_07155 [SAR324 cluster bacterium]|nr:hypothetical protein [SAR324 cluster bacterium]MBF0349781.1 hypothetical protein [SAR324 cluster bacterium]
MLKPQEQEESQNSGFFSHFSKKIHAIFDPYIEKIKLVFHQILDPILKYIPDRILNTRPVAIVEALGYISFVNFIAFMSGNEQRFIDVSPHPYWLIILLHAYKYGTNEAVITTLISIFFLYAGNVPEQRLAEDIYDYLLKIAYRPLLWFGASVGFGEMRLRQVEERNLLQKNLKEALARDQTITLAYQLMKENKEKLETRLASELQSSITMFEIFKNVEGLNPVRFLLSLGEILSVVLEPLKHSVYIFQGTDFELISATGWEPEEKYARKIPVTSPIFQELVSRQRILCKINQEDARILNKEGLIAGPLIDPVTNEVFGMVKIEELDFMDLNLNTIENFKGFCQWVGYAFAQAKQLQVAKANQMYTPDTGLFTYYQLKIFEQTFRSLTEQQGTEGIQIFLFLDNPKDFSSDEKKLVAQQLGGLVKNTLPEQVLMFGGRKHTMFSLVVPSTNPQQLQQIYGQLVYALATCDTVPLNNATVGFEQRQLYSLHQAA